MPSPSCAQVAPVVILAHGQAVTTSLEVARYFHKRHDDVLKKIRALIPKLSTEHARNFAEMCVEVEIGHGATRQDPAYELTRDGFTLLAMGFTGKKALAFKLDYIDAFNRMEAALREPPPALPPPELPPELADAIERRAWACAQVDYRAYKAMMARALAAGKLAPEGVDGWTPPPGVEFEVLTALAGLIASMHGLAGIHMDAVENLEKALGRRLRK